MAIFFIAVMNAVRNELTRRELQYSAAASLSALEGERSADVWNIAKIPVRTVEDFTRLLTDEERIGWKQTPRYTETGYKLARLPLDLRQRLSQFHKTSNPTTEEKNGHLQGDILLASISPSDLEDRLVAFLEGLLGEWTQQKDLHFVNSYGPRTYMRGATLFAHGDRIRTHAVSAIVFVDEKNIETPWALQFVENGTDGEDEVREVVLGTNADVLLYESTQPHGRVDPLQGDSFSAIFLHWRPAGWQEHVDRLLEAHVP